MINKEHEGGWEEPSKEAEKLAVIRKASRRGNSDKRSRETLKGSKKSSRTRRKNSGGSIKNLYSILIILKLSKAKKAISKNGKKCRKIKLKPENGKSYIRWRVIWRKRRNKWKNSWRTHMRKN